MVERTVEPTTWLIVTDPDPRPGDFDGELALVDASMVEHHAGQSDARLRVLLDGPSAAFPEIEFVR